MEQTELYLDTARLGRMSRRAQQAHIDFARLASEEGGSKFFERFLREGAESWSAAARTRFPGLAGWRGIASLKASLRQLAGSSPELPVLVVSRSSQLMKFAARLLFQSCRHVMATDLGWPPYREILDSEARRAGRTVTTVSLRNLLMCDCIDIDDVMNATRERFLSAGCDGLFLTAVSHHGLRLPCEKLVRALEAAREVRSVVIDGAQDFCHASADLNHEYCDMYLAGCHKWLGAFHPMGLGFYGRRSSTRMIETLVGTLLTSGELDDPLLTFTTQIESTRLDGETETVGLIPLFTCQGAADDALEHPCSLPDVLSQRQANVIETSSLAAACGWQPLLPAEAFRTGILLVQAERQRTRQNSADELRDAFAANGVALTAYEKGIARLSMPAESWQPLAFDRLDAALTSVA
ncbi:MAG TPA: aminotransferase class V-fold PLP-dependent enzyme [Pirellulales bacterium]|nr:aminotransferase class V-fold PLP-dependent enzyme [Pirellulales bacterium]